MKKTIEGRWLLAGLIAALIVSAMAGAQDNYPNRPVRIIAPFAPGGSTDVAARVLADRLAKVMGQQFLVDNRAGAGGVIGIEAAAKAAPDGQTLVIGSLTTTVLATARDVPLPYDPVRDFQPISLIVSIPLMIAATPTLDAANFQAFAAQMKVRPGHYVLGSAGQGTSGHIIGEYLASVLKTKIRAVHYRGAAPVLPDLLEGRSHFTINPPALLAEYINNGRLKGLVIFTRQRNKLVPAVPTMGEAGLTAFEGRDWGSWNGLFAPTGTPAAIVDRLNREINAALTDAAIAKRLDELGFDVLSGFTPATTANFVKEQFAHWLPVVRASGVKLE